MELVGQLQIFFILFWFKVLREHTLKINNHLISCLPWFVSELLDKVSKSIPLLFIPFFDYDPEDYIFKQILS